MANDDSFWTGDDDGMAQKYTGPLTTICFGQSAFSFQSGSGSSKTNSEKSGVANDNSFWAVDDDGMAQKYTDLLQPYFGHLSCMPVVYT